MVTTRRWLFGLSALLLAVPPAYGERLPFKSYTTADGLAHDTVIRIVRDSRGFLWFCTMGGLARFAGDTCVSFATEEGLPADRVNDLLETHGLTFRTRAHRRGPADR